MTEDGSSSRATRTAHAERGRVFVPSIMAATLAAVVVSLTGRGPQEPDVTTDEAKETLTRIIHETAELLGTDGWEESSAPSVQSCDGGNGIKWNYRYTAPRGDVDLMADAEKVAEHWETLGMSVRINTQHDPRVFATGGPPQGLSFVAVPESYSIGGTSACVPGNADQIRDEEYVG